MSLDALLDPSHTAQAVPLHLITPTGLVAGLPALDDTAKAWISANGYKAKAGTVLVIPGDDGGVGAVLGGLGEDNDPLVLSTIAQSLPPGTYQLDESLQPEGWGDAIALAWSLSDYRFSRYRSKQKDEDGQGGVDPEASGGSDSKSARLVWPDGVDRAWVGRCDRAIRMVRDMVNTPAEDMGPSDLADCANAIAGRHGATVSVIVGDGLLRAGYPMVHRVGRASDRPPRMIDLSWGDEDHPQIVIIGKGVCFDTGGLNLKPGGSMKLMKKDMGGAAHALALADMVMDADLPVHLRLLIPAVDNAVAGNAFRPGDILTSRKGLTVEIGNTDAEGRLVLADALAAGAESDPVLMINCATLTGAARVALGPDVPALYCNDEALAAEIQAAAAQMRDPLWRLPLHAGYQFMVESRVADLNNAPDTPFAGSITAALFLKAFVPESLPWAHLDLFAWSPSAKPGRPEGGAAQGLLALYETIRSRFDTKSR